MKLPGKPPDFTIEKISPQSLNSILSNGEALLRLAELGKEYPYWESFKYKVKSLPFPPEELWVISKLLTKGQRIKINLGDQIDFRFQLSVLPKFLEQLHLFDLNLGGSLSGDIVPAEDKKKYLISSLMEEAIASSQLEGASTTREIAKEMLRNNRQPKNISEKMIMNNYTTVQKVVALKNEAFTKERILDLHAIITHETLGNSLLEGRFRTTNTINVVDAITGDVYYMPPDCNRIEQLMEEFCAFANRKDDGEFVHPILKGIILHFLIGYIHPFADGNGRTARAIFYWYLVSKGYWLVEYMSISKVILDAPAQYSRAYLHTEFDNNDLTYFLQYNLNCMERALDGLHEYIKRKIAEKKKMFTIVSQLDLNDRQVEIIGKLLQDARQSLTIKGVQNTFGNVYQTARTDLIGLVEKGYLYEKRKGKKLVYFAVPDLEEKVKR